MDKGCRAPGSTGATEHGTAEAAGTGSVRRSCDICGKPHVARGWCTDVVMLATLN